MNMLETRIGDGVPVMEEQWRPCTPTHLTNAKAFSYSHVCKIMQVLQHQHLWTTIAEIRRHHTLRSWSFKSQTKQNHRAKYYGKFFLFLSVGALNFSGHFERLFPTSIVWTMVHMCVCVSVCVSCRLEICQTTGYSTKIMMFFEHRFHFQNESLPYDGQCVARCSNDSASAKLQTRSPVGHCWMCIISINFNWTKMECRQMNGVNVSEYVKWCNLVLCDEPNWTVDIDRDRAESSDL